MQMRLLSRRDALKLFGLSTGGLVIGCKSKVVAKKVEPSSSYLNTFVSINNDDTVDLMCHRSEMGQGVRTSIAMILADELDVDWNSIRVVQADGDEIYGDQNTDGSTTIRLQYTLIRELGATARAMLIGAAAQEWKCNASECATLAGIVTHTPTGRKRSYGSLAQSAAKQKLSTRVQLKASSDFKFIGKSVPAVDAANIVTGKVQYGIDIRVPNMLVASIERSPVIGGRIKSVVDAAALQVSGVKAVVKLDALPQSINTEAGVAVIATNTWAALKGRRQLKIEWDLTKAHLDSDTDRLRDLKAALKKPGKRVRNDGDVIKAKTPSSYSAEYYCPYLAHTTMEPPCATASVTPNGCEVWAPSQDPQRLRKTIATYLNISEEKVTIHVTFLGGGFGRKSQTDFAIEAVALSKKIGLPIKMVFTREDDIKHDFYHSDSYQVLKAGLDEVGMPVTWDHKTAFPTDMTVFNAEAFDHDDWELDMGASNMGYDIPHVRVEGFGVKSPVKIGWLRSVKNVFHAFAINGFLDELAEKAKLDPVEYRLRLLGDKHKLARINKSEAALQDNSRMSDLIRNVAAQAGWNKPLAAGDYRGFANHYSFHSYVAAVATIRLLETGEVRVKRIDIGIDCGLAVNPNIVQAQLEGATVFGLSLALFGEINLDKGQVRQSNFYDYRLLKMHECPQIHVFIAKNNEAPTGVGEPAVPPIAPALANAIYKATGKRLRNLPLRWKAS